jgi:predicted ATPase
MLNLFRISNFKGLVNAEFRPSGINLILGDNNAGKTSLCQALRFLSLTSSMPIDDAAKLCTPEPWNLLNVYTPRDTTEIEVRATLDCEGEELNFTYLLTIAGGRRANEDKPTSRAFQLEYECLRLTGGKFEDTMLFENKSGSVRLIHEKRYLNRLEEQKTSTLISSIPFDPVEPVDQFDILQTLGTGISGNPYIETHAPLDSTMLFRLYDLETNRKANFFKKYLESWSYYSFDPVKLRSNAAIPMDRTLNSDGSNLCSVVYTLHNERPRDERKLVEAVRLVEPRLDLVSFQSPDPDHAYMFFEDKQGHRFGVQNISEGTLRYMAMCFLVIANRKTEINADVPSPLIMIEEPENGIFVGHLKALFEKIDPSGKQGQFVFTSHNPYFIDLFDSALEGLHLVKSNGAQSFISQPNVENLKKRLGSFSLGEMHFRGLIE